MGKFNEKFVKNLSDFWKKQLTAYPDFPEFTADIMVFFADGSKFYSPNACWMEDEKLNELFVCTEHCGYFVFPLTTVAEISTRYHRHLKESVPEKF